MIPPFELTSKILSLCTEIVRLIGPYEGIDSPKPKIELIRQNRIRSIQGSLAIEGNVLSVEQVSAIVDRQRIIGPKRDILEVQNAIQAYDELHKFNPLKAKSLLRAHQLLMNGLVADAGRWRTKGVGILKHSVVTHVAPPAARVPSLMDELFRFISNPGEIHPIICSAVFHYEFEFIHPFSDGNGRAGRLWQTVLLTAYSPLFEFVPVESVIRNNVKKYYKALESADRSGSSTAFIEFSLQSILDALQSFLTDFRAESQKPEERLEKAKKAFGAKEFGRKDYIRLFPKMSTATASRDLSLGLSGHTLRKTGAKALTRYRFKAS